MVAVRLVLLRVPLEISSICPSKKRNHRDGQVDRQVFIVFDALKGCLDGHVTIVHHERSQNQYPADVIQENVERQRRSAEGSGSERTRDPGQVVRHTGDFPFSDNLTTLMFIVVSDLSVKPQRERETHKFPFSPGNECHCLHFRSRKNSVRGIVLYAEKLNGKPFPPRERTRQQHERDLHRGRLLRFLMVFCLMRTRLRHAALEQGG